MSELEGWGYLAGKTPFTGKWHYFVGNRSICGSRLIPTFVKVVFEQGDDDSLANCEKCRKALEKKRSKEVQFL